MAQRDRRGAARPAVKVHRATVAEGANENVPVAAELIDVSIYGCRVAAPVGPDVEGAIIVSLDGSAPVPAQIVWNREGVLGCRFDSPITGALLRSLTIRAVED